MKGIPLQHPVHGVKVAYFPEEADADKRNGWTEYRPPGKTYENALAPQPVRRKRKRSNTTEAAD